MITPQPRFYKEQFHYLQLNHKYFSYLCDLFDFSDVFLLSTNQNTQSAKNVPKKSVVACKCSGPCAAVGQGPLQRGRDTCRLFSIQDTTSVREYHVGGGGCWKRKSDSSDLSGVAQSVALQPHSRIIALQPTQLTVTWTRLP